MSERFDIKENGEIVYLGKVYSEKRRFSCTLKRLVKWLRQWGYHVYLCIALGAFFGISALRDWEFWAVVLPVSLLVELRNNQKAT